MIDPNTFHLVSRPGFSILNVVTAIPRGFIDAANVVILVFMIGGSFGVIKKIGIIEAGVSTLTKKFSGKGVVIIPILFSVFAVIAAFVGGVELCLIYIPILMPLLLALGFDSMITVGIALCATAIGYTAALTNPFTIGIGHQIGQLPMYSGMGFRAVVMVSSVIAGCIYFIVYAKKIQRNPAVSLVYEEDKLRKQEINRENKKEIIVTTRHKLAGIGAAVVFIGLIVGIVTRGWGMNEMAGFFILFGLVPGVLAGLRPNEIGEAFTEGFKDILVGALICGIARGIATVMSDALAIDTIIYYLAKFVVVLPSQLSSIGMLLVITVFNAIVPSGSGKALITMPIMLPLADFAGVTRQAAILAYQFGDGVTNILWPASGYFMAALAVGKISYSKWVKFVLPLLIIWTVMGCVFLVIAHAINWGPF
jgi:uncharacterized ion transporter superfamily protein YfcC